MHGMKRIIVPVLGVFLAGTVFTSCADRSAVTGFKYNDTKWGGFENIDYRGQATGPNLVLIQGGTFTMGMTEQDVTYEFHNVPAG